MQSREKLDTTLFLDATILNVKSMAIASTKSLDDTSRIFVLHFGKCSFCHVSWQAI